MEKDNRSNWKSYALWNNKGGVGKSTITFHLASRYAECKPDSSVLVIDLCPQANSSMMLLGGGKTGEEEVLQHCIEATPRTVVGYLSKVIAGGSGAPLPDVGDFLTQVNEKNSEMPSNLLLLCGDGNLEPMAPAIQQAASAPALLPTAQPWKWVHLVFRNLIRDLAEKQPNKELCVFVDTNPSFSIYTEIAIASVVRLICPVNADDSSRVAINALFLLLHGQTPPHPIYGSWTFAEQAKRHQVEVPKIHLIIGNRLTQYSGAAKAFGALSDATADVLFKAFKGNPEYFTEHQRVLQNLEAFRHHYSVLLRDFNTAGVVSAHLGKALSKMQNRSYEVHGQKIQIHKDRVEECLKAIDEVVGRI
jgi:cellulose biosynthesis protein BcsQ